MTESSDQLVHLDNPADREGIQPLDAGKKHLFGLDSEALTALMVQTGEQGWRGTQIAEAIYRQRIVQISEITTLSKSLRQGLAA
ncbi:MAG: hypothetical protein ABR905_16305, partial [Terracidiphilus sp.]